MVLRGREVEQMLFLLYSDDKLVIKNTDYTLKRHNRMNILATQDGFIHFINLL